jgi:hypothetical protein
LTVEILRASRRRCLGEYRREDVIGRARWRDRIEGEDSMLFLVLTKRNELLASPAKMRVSHWQR